MSRCQQKDWLSMIDDQWETTRMMDRSRKQHTSRFEGRNKLIVIVLKHKTDGFLIGRHGLDPSAGSFVVVLVVLVVQLLLWYE